jgi:hypothetical protein
MIHLLIKIVIISIIFGWIGQFVPQTRGYYATSPVIVPGLNTLLGLIVLIYVLRYLSGGGYSLGL